MKINSSQLSSWLSSNDASAHKKVLFFGNDESAIDFAKEQFIKEIKAKIDATVLSIDYTALENPLNLLDKLNSMDLFGNVEIISLCQPKNFNKTLQQKIIDSKFHNYLIIDGGDLKPSSALRKSFETEKGLLAVACYQDDARALIGYINIEINAGGYSADQDVAPLLLDILPANRFIIRQEIEKLKLYKVHDKVITSSDVFDLCVDSKEVSFSDFNSSIATFNFKKLSEIVTKLNHIDLPMVSFARVAIRYLEKLHTVLVDKESGTSLDHAVGKLQPPIFFKEKDAFLAQARSLTVSKIRALMGALTTFEYEVKLYYHDATHSIAVQNLFMKLRDIK